MRSPRLEPGESLLAVAENISVKSIAFYAFLTTDRIILINRDTPAEPDKNIPRNIIEAVTGSVNGDGCFVLSIHARSRAGAIKTMNLVFPTTPGSPERRSPDLWMRYLNRDTGQPASAKKSASHEERVPHAGGKLRFNNGIHSSGRDHTRTSPVNMYGSPPEPDRHDSSGNAGGEPQAAGRCGRRETGIRNMGETGHTLSIPDTVPAGSCCCNRCGTLLPSGSRFCSRCGAAAVPSDDTGTEQQTCQNHDHLTVPQEPERAKPGRLASTRPDPVFNCSTGPCTEAPPERCGSRISVQKRGGREGDPCLSPCRTAAPKQHPVLRRRMIIATVIVLSIIVITAAGYLLMPGLFVSGVNTSSGTAADTPPLKPAAPASSSTGGAKEPAATSVSIESSVLQATGTVPVPLTGVFVKISYSGTWQGSYGTISDAKETSGSGEKIFQLADVQEPVAARFQKKDSGAGILTAGIYRNGLLIQSGSTRDLAGSVDISAEV